ncbi:MAG: threonine synthase [Candidatus Bipolaricaulaceae bacterium]
MGEPTAFRCIGCGREYPPWSVDYTCPRCGPVAGTLEVLYDYGLLARRFTPTSFAETRRPSMWRYEELLPVGVERAVPLRVGWTPVYECRTLAGELGLSSLWFKDDALNPTASYKDRASAVAVGAARKLDRSAMACASTGNAATSLAGLCASIGMPCYIFVPRTAPRPKVAQLIAFGAMVFAVNGSYDQAFDLCTEAADKFGWYNRSAAINPMNVEGKKTGALELWEQLDGEIPDYVLVSVGDGSIVSGLCKGFTELARVGLTRGVPRVYGVQADGSAAVAHAFQRHARGEALLPAEEGAKTFADSIRVGKPRDVVKAVRYVSATQGGFVTASDEEILAAAHDLPRKTGLFAEPAAATAYAGLLALRREGAIPAGARVAVFITGSGLKDPDGVLQGLGKPAGVPPELAAVERALAGSDYED